VEEGVGSSAAGMEFEAEFGEDELQGEEGVLV